MIARGRGHDNFSLSSYWSDLRSDYDAAKDTRHTRKRKGYQANGGNADYHYRNELLYFKIVEKSRDLERNDPLIGQGLRRNRDNVIRGGFKLDPQTGDDGLDADIKAMWQEWAEDPHQVSITGEQDFHDLEECLYYQYSVDGDIFALTTSEGSVEVIENHRVRSPRTKQNVVHGVLLDKMRRRKQYWVSVDDIDPHRSTASMNVSEFRKISAINSQSGLRQVLHIYDSKRASQTRGIPISAPIQDTTGMISDSDFANLVAQQVSACFIMIEERDASTVAFGRDSSCDTAGGGRLTAQQQSPGSDLFEVLQNVAPGLKLKPEAGSTIKGFSPDIPSPQYQSFRADQLGVIAVNLDLPLAVLLLDPSMTNFSGWRGAIEQARKSWRRSQVWFSKRLHRPVYMWKLWQWAQQDRMLKARMDGLGAEFFRHTWGFPRWEYIEPEKDARTRELRKSQTSLTRLLAEDGEDFRIVATEMINERKEVIVQAQTAAAEINGQFPDMEEPISWRTLLPILIHGQFSQSQDVTIQKEEPEPVAIPGGGNESN